MKHILITIAAVLFVGCGNSELDENLRRDAYFGNIEAVKKHLDKGARVNSKDSEFLTTALHSAASQGHYKVVQILIDNGAELNANDVAGMTPFDSAVFAGGRRMNNTVTSDLLLSLGAKSGAEKSMYAATILGDVQSIKKLTNGGEDVNKLTKTGKAPLHLTATYGHKKATEYLLVSGANINCNDDQGLSPLFSAVRYTHKEIVELLISNGANIKTEKRLLHELSWVGHKKTEERIKQVEIAKSLILNGVNLNEKDLSGDTPLHSAAESGHREMVEFLLESGANVNEVNETKTTPLHKAAVEGRDIIINILVQNGANVNPVIQSTGTFNTMTPLDLALQMNKSKTAQLLRKNGGKTGKELKAEWK